MESSSVLYEILMFTMHEHLVERPLTKLELNSTPEILKSLKNSTFFESQTNLVIPALVMLKAPPNLRTVRAFEDASITLNVSSVTFRQFVKWSSWSCGHFSKAYRTVSSCTESTPDTSRIVIMGQRSSMRRICRSLSFEFFTDRDLL